MQKRRRKPALRKPRHPFSLEREYKRILVNYVNEFNALVLEKLIPQLPKLAAQANHLRPDGINTDGWAENLGELMQSIAILFPQKTPKIGKSIDSMANKVSSWNYDEIQSVIRSIVGVDVFIQQPWLQEQLKAWYEINTQYVIKNLPATATTQIQGIALRGLAQGTPTKLIAKEIQKQFGVTKRRAEFIARDQVAKLNGQLTKIRQSELGVKKYIWSTVKDERVRPEHQEREGEIFSWDKPPDGGHPGEDYNCRCVAIPVMDDVLEKI